ncbi:MAG TPA: hypothetical protein VHQ91_15280, partial [Geminicoccaceae bacterium]|nr:hypothetical protein [Geminicoccaceae bacterium]
MSPGQRARRRWRAGPARGFAALLALALLLVGADARAEVCASAGGPADQVLARLPLYDPGRVGADGGIRSFTEGDPGATAGHAIVAV